MAGCDATGTSGTKPRECDAPPQAGPVPPDAEARVDRARATHERQWEKA